MKFKVVLGATCALFTTAARADAASLTGSTPGYHYFWKAGATIEDHDAAVVDCAVRLRAMVNGSDAMTAVTAATGGGLAGALIGGIIDSNENRQGDAANMEGCMALKGWSVVGFPDAEGEAVRDLDDASLIREKVSPLVGSAAPAGPVLRGPFANELVEGAFVVEKARDLDKLSLSVRATKSAADAAIDSAGELKPSKPELPKGVKAPKRIKGHNAKELVAADPQSAHIVLRLKGAKSRVNSTNIILSRLAPDGSEVVYDGLATTAALGYLAGTRLAKGAVDGETYADFVVPVPAGRWKMATISVIPYDADLCFGAPAFEIGDGETVFLGEMTVRDGGGYPLDAADLETARAILAANPTIAGRVRAPDWSNGFTSDCFGSYAYAYEIPGAPFIDGAALMRAGSEVTSPPENPAPQ